MTRAIKTSTVVQEGGRIEVETRELIPGTQVEVIILQNQSNGLPSIDEILAGYSGGRLFKSAKEVDDYIRTERDSWER